MLSVVCWKWRPRPGYRTTFMAEHVNVLRNMVRRHYQRPHRFICVTDDAEGLDQTDIEVIPLWAEHGGVQSPMGAGYPSCYRRLRMFSPDARTLFGERFVSLDLDCAVVGDLSPLWDRSEDFVIWGDTAVGTPYNGSMMLLSAGARPQVWDKFDPQTSPLVGKKLGYIGSDQAWIGACLGPNEPKWTRADGVLSFRNEVSKGVKINGARIVFFHGEHKPWHERVAKQHPWVAQHWR